MVYGSIHSREPITLGQTRTLETIKPNLYSHLCKKREDFDETLELPEGMRIIEVEILPIPPYRPDSDREAKEPDLSQRITHRPPSKTLH